MDPLSDAARRPASSGDGRLGGGMVEEEVLCRRVLIASASAADRLAMVELATAEDARFAVSDCDIVRHGETYTFDTVQIFRQQFPLAQLWWLMGSDSLMQLHTWKKWQTLVRQTHIAVAMRQGDNLNKTPRELHAWLGEALQNGSVRILNAPLHNTSSTQIRANLAKTHHSDGLPQPVAQYIRQHKLYEK